MINVNFIARAGAVLLIAGSNGVAFAGEALGVLAAEDGAVDVARQCDVYVAGVTTSRSPEPVRFRWLDGATEVTSWTEVRADGSAPLELCGLRAGEHRLTLQVTDGDRIASDTMVATIVGAPDVVAGR